LSGIQHYTMGITEFIILKKHTAFIFKDQTVLEESHDFLQNTGILPSDNISYSRRMNESMNEILIVKAVGFNTNITVQQSKCKYKLKYGQYTQKAA